MRGRTPHQFAWAVRVRRCAVHRPEHPSDDTVHEPEPDDPDSLPEAEPWTPLFCRARLTDPLGPTCPDTLTPEPPARTLPFWTARVWLTLLGAAKQTEPAA